MNIFLSNDFFCLKKIPYKMVTDNIVKSAPLLGTNKFRKMGVAFGFLSKKQKTDLEFFIENHTIGLAEGQENIRFANA